MAGLRSRGSAGLRSHRPRRRGQPAHQTIIGDTGPAYNLTVAGFRSSQNKSREVRRVTHLREPRRSVPRRWASRSSDASSPRHSTPPGRDASPSAPCWAEERSWIPSNGAIPKGGLIAACGDVHLGEKWWFVHTDGLCFSPDGDAASSA